MEENPGVEVGLPYIQIDQVHIGGFQTGAEANIYRLHMLAFHWCWTAAMGAKEEGFGLLFNYRIWGTIPGRPPESPLVTGYDSCRIYKSMIQVNVNFGPEIITMSESSFMRAYVLHFGEALRYVEAKLIQRKRKSNIDAVMRAYVAAVEGYLTLTLPFCITQEELSHLATIVRPEYYGWVRLPLELSSAPSRGCIDLAHILAELLRNKIS